MLVSVCGLLLIVADAVEKSAVVILMLVGSTSRLVLLTLCNKVAEEYKQSESCRAEG